MKLSTLIYTRGAVHITRYHNVATRRESNVAEHSYGVANIVLFITIGRASANLLTAALHHDVAEIATGDIPAPVKSRNPEIKAAMTHLEDALNGELGILQEELTPGEALILKFADNYEGLLYSMEEYDMGNSLILPILFKWVRYLENHGLRSNPRADDLMGYYYNWMMEKELVYVEPE